MKRKVVISFVFAFGFSIPAFGQVHNIDHVPVKKSVLNVSIGAGIGTAQPELQSDEPQNVKDYYLLMPRKYDDLSTEERQELLDGTETFVDIKNGYIVSQIGELGERFQAALFKRTDGSYVFAYNEDGDPSTGVPTKLFLLLYHDGEWTDISTRLLPVPVNRKYHYDLPQIGTTINVETTNRKKMYVFRWKNGRFIKGAR